MMPVYVTIRKFKSSKLVMKQGLRGKGEKRIEEA
jgi:hypothetical protein